MSKVIRDFIGFALPRIVIGPEIKTRATQPIRCKTNTIHVLVACVFPRFRQFGCFYFEFSLAVRDIFFLLIGRCDYFGFGFTTLKTKLNRS